MIKIRQFNKIDENYFKEMISLVEKLLGKFMDLQQWNLAQKELWIELVNEDIVEEDDFNLFYKFGKAFENFFNRFKREPSTLEMEGLLFV